ncbi:MAG TPA: FecR family protein [Kofleriaceae bacterium]|nr:FecR family protein [Kofleriaceae bacterium]
MLCLVAGACKKGDDNKSNDEAVAKSQATDKDKEPSTPPAPAAAADTKPAANEVASSVGVSAGGIQRDPKEGPAAVITAVSGTVELKRVGEPKYQAAKAEDKLYSGDQVRTQDKSSATIAIADESVVELAEVSTLGIGSRMGSADPASSAAVLAGLARFSVSPRAPGEGAFRVYTPGGVVLTKGTTYGVGVAASGESRVGVESGKVEVVGLAQMDAQPVPVPAGSAIVLDLKGNVGKPAAWPSDDWGTWRDDADAKLDAKTAVDAHGKAMVELDKQLADSYADLTASADGVAQFEATAAASADKNDPAAYTAALPDGSAQIDGSFALAGRVEALTWAYAGHATLASDIYIRNPQPVAASWTVVEPRVDAAILWPKRYEVTAVAYLEPLRVQYYVHHPRGRIHAPLVGITVPTFYAQVEPPAIEPVRVRAHVRMPIWIAPEVTYVVSTRPIWIATPAIDWRTKIRVIAPARPRATVAWYVRPPTLRAHVLVGANVTGAYEPRLRVVAPEPRASLRAAWKVPVGVKVKVGAPDLAFAASTRAKLKLDGGGRLVVAPPGVNVHGGVGVGVPDVKGNVKAKVAVPDIKGKANVKVAAPDVKGSVKAKVAVPDVKAKVKVAVPDVKAKLKVGAGVHGGAGAHAGGGVGVKGGAGVKVKAPDVKVKVKAPAVKVQGQAKAGIKIGG